MDRADVGAGYSAARFVRRHWLLLALTIGGAMLATFLPGLPLRGAAPLVETALADGRIGEQSDGYLGFVTPPSPALRDVVVDINIRRRQGYTERALAGNVTIAEFAAATACQILRKLPAGRAFRIEDGPWQRRTEGDMVLPPDCGGATP